MKRGGILAPYCVPTLAIAVNEIVTDFSAYFLANIRYKNLLNIKEYWRKYSYHYWLHELFQFLPLWVHVFVTILVIRTSLMLSTIRTQFLANVGYTHFPYIVLYWLTYSSQYWLHTFLNIGPYWFPSSNPYWENETPQYCHILIKFS